MLRVCGEVETVAKEIEIGMSVWEEKNKCGILGEFPRVGASTGQMLLMDHGRCRLSIDFWI